MTHHIPYALALLAALLYVAAALSLKRSSELGAGLWHSSFVSNLLAALMFQALLVFGGTLRPIADWWQPALVALLYVVGQTLTLVSLQRGDVSIATPVLGIKVLLVAVFTVLLGLQTLRWQLWVAAALSTAGVACLNHSGAHKPGANALATILSAASGALCFALFDVLVQRWSPAWGFGRFLPVMFACVGVFSLAFIPLFPKSLHQLSRPSLRWLLGGGLLLSLQSVFFVSSIGYFGKAAALNVIYSSRGLWTILVVALLGHWFHSSERRLGASIFRWRLAGAALMFAAIFLVLS